MEEQECLIMPLGAGNEVGRSCIYLAWQGKKILLDCGIHPAYNGLAGLPYFDMIDPDEIDIVLITHFHLDHVGALPYFLERTTFKGKVFMTHPTKAIYKWLLLDYVKVSNVGNEDEDVLYSEKDLMQSYDKIQAVDYHQEIECNGVKFTCFNAGHVLGAAMFLIDIAGLKILYTGDYSREEDRHLLPAEVPPGLKVDILICESTYGVQSHEGQGERERRFVRMVHEVVGRGGKCLLPVFALGKAQELLLILDEYWEKHAALQDIPIYYASSLAKKCLAIYQTYLNMMNPRLRDTSRRRNPFVFKYVANMREGGGADGWTDTLGTGPCVVMASPGMLQNGLSRRLFEAWCADKKNGVVLPGYSVEGTLAKSILTEPRDIVPLAGGPKLPLKMSVGSVSFSAHVDFLQNASFIETIKAPHLVLVHGESNEMMRLKSALTQRQADVRSVDGQAPSVPQKIYTPRNCETVSIPFAQSRALKVVGELTKEITALQDGQESTKIVSGVIVGHNFDFQFVKASELSTLTPLSTACLSNTLSFATACPWPLMLHILLRQYGPANILCTPAIHMDHLEENPPTHLCIMTMVTVDYIAASSPLDTPKITLSWYSSPTADLFADAIMALLLSASSAPVSVKKSIQTHHSCNHSYSVKHESHKNQPEENINLDTELPCPHQLEDFVRLLKEGFYDEVRVDKLNPSLISVQHHGHWYHMNLASFNVQGPDATIVAHLEELLTLFSLATNNNIVLPVH